MPVCSGDQLELICNITGSTVEWSVFSIPEGGMTAVRYGRLFLNNGPNQAPVDLTVKSVLFNFSRTSPANEFPLISRLVTSPINNDINETEVFCRDTMTRNSSSTIVNVISEDLVQGKIYIIIIRLSLLIGSYCLQHRTCNTEYSYMHNYRHGQS